MDMEGLKDFLQGLIQGLQKSVDSLKDEVHDLSRRMQDDHDKIIRLEGRMDTLNKSFEDNATEEERYGRQFAKQLEEVANAYKKIETKQIEIENAESKDEAVKAKEGMELWKKIAIWVGAGGLGGGGVASMIKSFFGQ